MSRLGSTILSTGLVGAAIQMAGNSDMKREMFDDISVVGTAFMVVFVLLFIAFIVAFFYSVYKIMPRNKLMHVLLTIILSALWFVPSLFYYAYKGYSLRKN